MNALGDIERNAGREAGAAAGLSEYDGVLRFITCGSVDDGKSTLIGRLLHDTKAIFEDQLAAVQRASWKRGQDEMDLSLLTDGLEAEREQGITIDVAYRYFATPRRKFIIADTPGHEQYTRNMVTGASTADAAVVLIDARKGVLGQTRRHTCIAHLLGVRHIIVAVNKMDLVDYDQAVFDRIRSEVLAFSGSLGIPHLSFVPLSALRGDNVVETSTRIPWYRGPGLLSLLENIPLSRNANTDEDAFPARFPVQLVLRAGAGQDFRGYAGRLESGMLVPGDEVVALPSGQRAAIREILSYGKPQASAIAGDSVTLVLTDDIDLSRGDMLSDPAEPPRAARTLAARLCWFSQAPFERGTRFLLKHTTRVVKAKLAALHDRLDIHTLVGEPSPETLFMNDIAHVTLQLAQPVFVDCYGTHRATGSFILVDEATNQTVAAGMIETAPGNGG